MREQIVKERELSNANSKKYKVRKGRSLLTMITRVFHKGTAPPATLTTIIT
jgi:hypothetical protein